MSEAKRAFVVRAAESGWPIPGVYDSLKDGRATIGWSSRDNQDLRIIARMLDEGRELDQSQLDARRCLGFFLRPRVGDYLLYPNQPDRRKFTIVTVEGEYDYSADGGDFRSLLPCKLVTSDPISVYDQVVPSKLRADLGRQGRFYEIHDTTALELFLSKIEQSGETNTSNRPALARVHDDLRKHVPSSLRREFSRHDLSRKFCAELFDRMGHTVEVQEGPTEAGSDIVITLGNPLLPEDVQFRLGIQVFAYEGEVTRDAVVDKLDQLLAGWDQNGLWYGVLLTTGCCRPEAHAAIHEHNQGEKQNPRRLIRLIDADDLADLFLRYFPPEEGI